MQELVNPYSFSPAMAAAVARATAVLKLRDDIEAARRQAEKEFSEATATFDRAKRRRETLEGDRALAAAKGSGALKDAAATGALKKELEAACSEMRRAGESTERCKVVLDGLNRKAQESDSELLESARVLKGESVIFREEMMRQY